MSFLRERSRLIDLYPITMGALAWAATGGISGRTAHAFSKATAILRPYGVEISGMIADRLDNLQLEIQPIANTDYTETVLSPDNRPCVRTSVHRHESAVHEIFDAGAEDPYALVSTEFLDGGRVGAVAFVHHEASLPCVRTSIADRSRARHELFTDGAFDPCVRLDADLHGNGRIGAVAMTVEPSASLTIRVGTRLYRLVDGALVEV